MEIWELLVMQASVTASVYSYINLFYFERDIAGHERFGHMTRVYYKYA